MITSQDVMNLRLEIRRIEAKLELLKIQLSVTSPTDTAGIAYKVTAIRHIMDARKNLNDAIDALFNLQDMTKHVLSLVVSSTDAKKNSTSSINQNAQLQPPDCGKSFQSA